MKKYSIFNLLAFLIILLFGCSVPSNNNDTESVKKDNNSVGKNIISTAATYTYSFETGMNGWMADGTDLNIGSGLIDWHILRSNKMASQGIYSLEYYLNNINDAGKIWIETPFYVMNIKQYTVTVSFDIASSDSSTIGAFRIISGVSTVNPETKSDLTFQGDTYNGGKNGYVWMTKKYSFKIVPTSGAIYVAIGVWGVFEVPKTYYFDNINITIQ